MDDNHELYEIISGVIARCLDASADNAEIKAEIRRAIGGNDYCSALITYLWGAYYNLDKNAGKVFQDGLFIDLKQKNPDIYDFFSFYFQKSSKRRGFDRRSGEDRRKGYCLDYCAGDFVERRVSGERRNPHEKRIGWTRLQKWVSVPFTIDDALPDEEMGLPKPDEESFLAENKAFTRSYSDFHSLERLLSSLSIYLENYMQPGQTAWRDAVSPETLKRTEAVMRKFLARLSLSHK